MNDDTFDFRNGTLLTPHVRKKRVKAINRRHHSSNRALRLENGISLWYEREANMHSATPSFSGGEEKCSRPESIENSQ
jgi:hypothetical protein